MAQTYHPFDAGAGANIVEAQWRTMARHWVHGGSGRVLATELNKLSTIGDSTGMQVKVDTGRAWVAGHFYENDAQLTLAISSNASGNPRIDRVVIRADFTANTIAATVITGTPAASPTAPALTQSTSVWDIPLAQVAVANGAVTIAAGNVTDERPLIGPSMGAGRFPSTTARDLMLTGVAGMVCMVGDTVYQHNGSAWVEMTSAGAWTDYTPAITQSASVSATVTYARYRKQGRRVEFECRLSCTSSGTSNNAIAVALPVTASSSGLIIGASAYVEAGSVHPMFTYLASTTVVNFYRTTGAQTAVVGTTTASGPTLASGTALIVHGSYESAS